MTDLILNAAIFVITLCIFILFFYNKGRWDYAKGSHAMRFFTAQSNVLCAVSAFLMCLIPENEIAWTMKYIGTAGVTVTMMTVFLFMGPAVGSLKKMLEGAELFMHLITPVLAIVSFVLLERRGMSFLQSLWGMLPVSLYGPWYLYKVKFAPEEKRWEDFYRFNQGDKWPVSFSALGTAAFLICMGFLALQNTPLI